MLEITFQYVPISSDSAFLMIKQTEVQSIFFYLEIFYLHVFSSIGVLFFGFFQFFIFKKKYFPLHRIFGKIYVFLILFFAAPSGLFIGYYANGNNLTKISFIILGILWWYFTLIGFIKAKSKQIQQHKFFMWRSFALTLSAVTLRIWKVVIVFFFQPQPLTTYNIISWLGWIPNLLFVEYLIHLQKNKK